MGDFFFRRVAEMAKKIVPNKASATTRSKNIRSPRPYIFMPHNARHYRAEVKSAQLLHHNNVLGQPHQLAEKSNQPQANRFFSRISNSGYF